MAALSNRAQRPRCPPVRTSPIPARCSMPHPVAAGISRISARLPRPHNLFHRHFGAPRSGEPGIHTHNGGYGFRARAFRTKLTLRVNFVSTAHPGMTTALVACARKHESHANPEVLDRLRLSRAQG